MITPNLIVNIAADPKKGKTHWALTFPDPLVIFSFDVGLEPILKKFEDKEIDVRTYPMPLVDSVKATGFQKELKDIWDDFNNSFKKATEDTNVKSIVVDPWTITYQIACVARAHELGQANLLQFQYGDVYARLRSLIQAARLAGQNLALTSYLRDRFVNDQNTGQKESAGWNGTAAEVDIVLWLDRKTVNAPGGKKKTTFMTTIKDSRYEPEDLIEMEFESIGYPDLIDLVLGE